MVVSGVGARRIQPSFGAEAENILQRHDGEGSLRTLCQPDQTPVRTIRTGPDQSINRPPLMLSESPVPAEARVVVMCPAVNHATLRNTMGQVRMGAHISKRKLQNGHARNFVAVSQRDYIGRYKSQVFSEEWKPA